MNISFQTNSCVPKVASGKAERPRIDHECYAQQLYDKLHGRSALPLATEGTQELHVNDKTRITTLRSPTYEGNVPIFSSVGFAIRPR